MSEFAVIEDGSWTGETVRDPQKHTDVALATSARMKDAGFWPIYERDPGPKVHTEEETNEDGEVTNDPVKVPRERESGAAYDVDSERRVVYKHVQYEDRPLQDYKEDLREEAKLRRQSAGRAPIEYDGGPFEVDRDSQLMISSTIETAKRYNANHSDEWTAQWKLANGDFQQVTQSDLESVYALLEDQVESAFAREAEINAQIDAASTHSDLDAIDITAGWP
jgi:hypothetical protein